MRDPEIQGDSFMPAGKGGESSSSPVVRSCVLVTWEPSTAPSPHCLTASQYVVGENRNLLICEGFGDLWPEKKPTTVLVLCLQLTLNYPFIETKLREKTVFLEEMMEHTLIKREKMPEVTPRKVTGAKQRIWQRTKSNAGLAAKHQEPGRLLKAGRLNRTWGERPDRLTDGFTGIRVQLAIGLKEQAQPFIAASLITGEAPTLLSAHGAGNATARLEADRWTKVKEWKPGWIERAPHLQT
ncbi:hypothetical protein QYF61_007760 [Mycteria americana]|uniref:Uncharacterized protein n=1 Tax=Mycteria americana TaxID=33587 RepID=A0AAN7MKX7_MYCAM|nr:hypothetical protein QYF61_007760 [Mycteria americana]